MSRATENLGRVYIRMGEYKKAIDIFEKKVPTTGTALEMAWLFHEIGRCYLELGKYGSAKDYGQKSLTHSEEAKDALWQLNGKILIAQAEVKLKEYDLALESLQQSLEMAQGLEDKSAQQAIRKAISDVRRSQQADQSDSQDDEGIEATPAVVEGDIESAGEHAEQAKEVNQSAQAQATESDKKTAAPANKEEKKKSVAKEKKNDTEMSKTETAKTDANQSKEVERSDGVKSKSPERNEQIEVDANIEEESNQAAPVEEPENVEKSVEIQETLAVEPKAQPESPKTDVADEDTKNEKEAVITRYKVAVRISDVEGAGTSEDLYIQIIGDQGVTRKETLEQTAAPGGKFDQGTTNEFTVASIDVGKVMKLIVGRTSMRSGSGCHIADVSVEVVGSSPPQRYLFPCDKWFDNTQEDGALERELTLLV